MYVQKRKRLGRILLIGDFISLFLGFFLAYFYWSYVRFHENPFNWPLTEHQSAQLILGTLTVITWPIILQVLGLYDLHRINIRKRRNTVKRVLFAAIIVSLIAGSCLFFFKIKLASRSTLLLMVSISTILLLGVRLFLNERLRKRPSGERYRVLVVGSSNRAENFNIQLKLHPELGCDVVGFVKVEGEKVQVPEDKILGSIHDIGELLDDNVVDQVAIAVSSADLNKVEPVVLSCEEVGVDVTIVAYFFERLLQHASLDHVGNLPLLHLHATPQFRATMATKRLFDIIVASFIILLTSPVMIFAVLSVRLSSKGPALFVQERMGLNGRTFSLYKFRTMVLNAEALKSTLSAKNEMTGPVFKVRSDPRITKTGKLLRRFSIDELPQLFNVIKGDMSIVGPRPPLAEEVKKYDRWQRRRLSVRPGLTCTWQVSGRNDIDFDRWMKLDLDYINNWSPWLDVRIILQTIPAVLTGRGAS